MSSKPNTSPDRIVECVDIDGRTHRVSISELRWRPSAYSIVIKDGALLVSPQFDGYDLPGGGLDLGEMPEDAVIRETREETGLEVRNPKILGVGSSLFKLPHSRKGIYIHGIQLYYLCEYAGGEFSMDGFDEYEKKYARMPEWLPLEKMDSIKLASSTDWRKFVRQAMAASTSS